MSKFVVINNLTLDGVMQAPGRPDEDTRGGFEHGGWARLPNEDPDIGRAMAGRMAHQQDNPFTEVLNNVQKYVASTTLEAPLPRSNSTLLGGDAAEAVADHRKQPGEDLVILGSGELVQSLMRRALIDEYVLLIHPLVLGSGRRLFRDGGPFAALRLADAVTTATGVVIASYQSAQPGSAALPRTEAELVSARSRRRRA